MQNEAMLIMLQCRSKFWEFYLGNYCCLDANKSWERIKLDNCGYRTLTVHWVELSGSSVQHFLSSANTSQGPEQADLFNWNIKLQSCERSAGMWCVWARNPKSSPDTQSRKPKSINDHVYRHNSIRSELPIDFQGLLKNCKIGKSWVPSE